MKTPDSNTKKYADAGCPSDEVWDDLAAGLLSEDVTAKYVAHAARCAHCAPLLREATEHLAIELTDEEKLEIASTFTPAWQREMASRMAASTFRAEPVRSRWRIPVWAYAAVAALVVAAVGLWVTRESPLHETERLLAESYAEQRTMDLRFGDAAYGEKRVQRGAKLDAPASFSSAKEKATSGLDAHPEDPAWLTARGEVDLLEGEYEKAMNRLQQAAASNAKSSAVKKDLAVAYFERAESLDRPIDYGTAYQLLSEALALQPNDPVAIYNRAMASERLTNYRSAIEDWNHYLQLDASSGWAKEARRHLADINRKLKSKLERGPPLWKDPSEFSARASPQQIEESIEAYLEIATRYWISHKDARSALEKLARVLIDKHQDRWLADMLTPATSSASMADAEALSAAIIANAGRSHDRAFVAAKLAQKRFAAAANPAGVLRARIEEVYALRMSLDSRRSQAAVIGLAQEAERRSYRWIATQGYLEQSSSLQMALAEEASDAAVRAGLALSERYNFPILRLRALGFVANHAGEQGDAVRRWKGNRDGLLLYWGSNAPPIRAYQFYVDSLSQSEIAGNTYLGMALAAEAIETAPSKLDEAHARYRLAALASSVGNAGIAQSEFDRGNQIFANLQEKDNAQKYRVAAVTGMARLDMEHGLEESALRHLAEAEPVLDSVESSAVMMRYYRTLGDARRKQGNPLDAEKQYRTAAVIAESALKTIQDERSRIHWNEQTAPVYRALADIAWKMHKNPEEAWRIWEWFRGSALRTKTAGSPSSSDVQGLDFKNLKSASFEYPAVHLSELAAGLHNETRLVYAMLPSGIGVWTVSDKGVSGHWLNISQQDADILLRRFARLCSRPDSNLADLQKTAAQLYAALLGPVAMELSAGRTIVVEADGVIGDISFQALVDPSGQYLSERFEFASSPGLLYADRLRASSPITAIQSALVVGDPENARLSDAREEATWVAARFANSIVLKGSLASRDNLRREMPKASVLHIAAHFQASPAGVGFQLSPGPGDASERPVFTVDDFLASLPRQCQLAVLSGCGSERGEQAGVNDAESVVRGLLAAGIPRVVASRWNVDSESTASFMRNFYNSLLAGKSIPACVGDAGRAIRQTSGRAHPYYWAAFNGFGRS